MYTKYAQGIRKRDDARVHQIYAMFSNACARAKASGAANKLYLNFFFIIVFIFWVREERKSRARVRPHRIFAGQNVPRASEKMMEKFYRINW